MSNEIELFCPKCGIAFKATPEAIYAANEASTTVPCPNPDCGRPPVSPPVAHKAGAKAGKPKLSGRDTVLMAALACMETRGPHIFRSHHAVMCWAISSAQFGLAGYAEHPDTKRLDAAISGMVKKGLFYYVLDKPNHWALTPTGLERAQALRPEPKKATAKGKRR